MRTLTRAAVVALVLVGCVGCDQASKAVVRAYVPVGQAYTYLDGAVRIQLAENPGAFLSVGESLPRETRSLMFEMGVGTLVLGLLGCATLVNHLTVARRVCLTLIAAGGAGNLLDRILHGGSVTDFLYIGVGRVHTGIFNVADLFLCIALAALLFDRSLHADAGPD